MNLQQLNAEGQPLRTFIITAILAMALTGLVWMSVVQANSVRRWLRTGEMVETSEPSKSVRLRVWRPKYTIAVRLAMLCYLVRHRQTKWMFRSRIWFHILRNSGQKGLHPNPDGFRRTKEEETVAGHHVSSLIQDEIPCDISFKDVQWYWTRKQWLRKLDEGATRVIIE